TKPSCCRTAWWCCPARPAAYCWTSASAFRIRATSSPCAKHRSSSLTCKASGACWASSSAPPPDPIRTMISTDTSDSLQDQLRLDRRAAVKRRVRITLWQVLILAVILGSWETLTRIPWFTQNTLFDPFFISQPSRVAVRLWEWLQPGPRSVWPHLLLTLEATLVGLVVGVGSGFLVGMTLSRSRMLADVFNPFIVAFNSMPRIAFVPLITMFFGLGLASKVVTSWFVVFFLVFFNTYKGGR